MKFNLITFTSVDDFNTILCELPSGVYLNMEDETPTTSLSQSILMSKFQFNSFYDMIEDLCSEKVTFVDYDDYLNDEELEKTYKSNS
jgi:hypothetical protein